MFLQQMYSMIQTQLIDITTQISTCIFFYHLSKTGSNLSGYINELRLNHAIHLLKEHPEYTLRAIAEASGINSMPTFHSLFKNKTGMTPSEFKKTQMDMKQ